MDHHIINGGNDLQTAALAIDTLTGNGGADIFQFNISTTLSPSFKYCAVMASKSSRSMPRSLPMKETVVVYGFL